MVKLNSGVDYRGILACLDGFMNIAMEQTEEYVDGQLKARYGDCFIRGNNGKNCNCVLLVVLYIFKSSAVYAYKYFVCSLFFVHTYCSIVYQCSKT